MTHDRNPLAKEVAKNTPRDAFIDLCPLHKVGYHSWCGWKSILVFLRSAHIVVFSFLSVSECTDHYWNDCRWFQIRSAHFNVEVRTRYALGEEVRHSIPMISFWSEFVVHYESKSERHPLPQHGSPYRLQIDSLWRWMRCFLVLYYNLIVVLLFTVFDRSCKAGTHPWICFREHMVKFIDAKSVNAQLSTITFDPHWFSQKTSFQPTNDIILLSSQPFPKLNPTRQLHHFSTSLLLVSHLTDHEHSQRGMQDTYGPPSLKAT